LLHNIVHNVAVTSQIGSYSDAIEVPPGARWLLTSGTPGLALDGGLPADINGQAELAWGHIINTLKSAGMTVNDLVKVTHYLLHERDVPDYVKVRSRFLGDARPASMLLTGAGLVWSGFLLEIEAVAAKV
jgi:enamine deaminase RidA (YjgF/YER057c/UK114 family)